AALRQPNRTVGPRPVGLMGRDGSRRTERPDHEAQTDDPGAGPRYAAPRKSESKPRRHDHVKGRDDRQPASDQGEAGEEDGVDARRRGWWVHRARPLEHGTCRGPAAPEALFSGHSSVLTLSATLASLSRATLFGRAPRSGVVLR